MNGRTRIAVTAATATVLTALCLWPLVTPSSWIVVTAGLLALIVATGAGARRLAMPRPVVILLQLLVGVLLITFAFASGAAVGRILPGPEAVRQLGSDLASGVDDMSHFATPAPATVGLRLLLTLAVLGIGLLVDAVAVTYQRVALAGLPLLALYAVGTGIHPAGPVWFFFLVATFGYLALLMAEGRDRVARWGRIFYGNSGADDGTSPLTSSGLRIASVAVAGGLLLPLVLPSVGAGLISGLGHGNGTGDGGVITAVNPLASLAQSLQQATNEPVLTYTTTAASVGDQYLRIVDLDQFNGVSWTTSPHRAVALPSPLGTPAELNKDVPADAVNTRIVTESSYGQQWLPMPYPATDLAVQGNWRWEPEGRTIIGADNQTAASLVYQVRSLALHPSADELRQAPPAPKGLAKTYTYLPSDLPQVVAEQARQVTRGASDDFDRAVLLQNWFSSTGGFSYDTNVPVDAAPNALADFLARKKGFCVHYASAMAAMARSLGIPARVVVGFTPGDQNPDGSWTVSTHDAHAWPELYFTGVGWLRFEPTPRGGTVPPDYSTQSTSPGSTAAPTAGPTAGAQPTGGAHSHATCPPQALRAGDCGLTNPLGGAPAQSALSPDSPLLLAVWSLAGLLLALLIAPMLWRSRTRRSRLRRGPAGLTDQQVLAAWRELIDTAWDHGIPPDDAETPRHTAARISELGDLGPGPSAAAGRLALATEQVLYAPAVSTPLSLRQDVREVREGLAAAADRRTRLRAVLLPPSAARRFRLLPRRIRAAVSAWTRDRAAALRRRLRPRS
ncbi:transglutaminase TgpA family protein [Streptacidiphilus jiangxiensis]|uniref:Transglutaminase-like domain-containing protein n=1 Tax=Streptacidiphilus jiangxiensis TaxID=235985 RepID=A0A1H7SNJ2_STRJI|nr:DUF3488 and transglutaminase-like domain-containing protein [Streptacidiphilus jiangxiensis]SEL74045.1 protein of unknown function [Streptacidiphilus jiangxiensis]